MNSINNTIYTAYDARFIQPQHQADTQKLADKHKALQLRRQQVFFSPYVKNETNELLQLVNQTAIKQNNSCFYHQINTADINTLKQLCVEQLNKLSTAIDYYDNNSSNKEKINTFISRIKDYSYALVTLQYTTCCIYEIVLSLHKFSSEQENSTNKNPPTIINKNAIISRIKILLNDLDKCWEGTYHRLHTENEILNAIDKGLAGKLFLIRKNLADILIINYANNVENPGAGEVHTHSAMINLINTSLGLNPKIDANASSHLSENFVQDFYETAITEISEAVIARELTNDFYQQVISTLQAQNKTCWLTEKLSLEDFTAEIIHNLDINFFIPINMLFDTEQSANKLTIYSIMTIIENNDFNDFYSFNLAYDKLYFWITNNLMPNTEVVLPYEISNPNNSTILKIATIDYMYFWVFNPENSQDIAMQEQQTSVFADDNYIPLQLCHLKNIDFYNILDTKDNSSFADITLKNKQIAMTLIIQAMQNTNNADEIIEFLSTSPIHQCFGNKYYSFLGICFLNLITKKLTNENFKEKFITTCKAYFFKINSSTLFTQDELLTTVTVESILKNIINSNTSFRKFLCLLFIKFDEIKTFNTKKLSTLFDENNFKLLFLLALKLADYDFASKLVRDNLCDNNFIVDYIFQYIEVNHVELLEENNDELMSFLIEHAQSENTVNLICTAALQADNINIINYIIKYYNSKFQTTNKLILDYACDKKINTIIITFINNDKAYYDYKLILQYAITGNHTDLLSVMINEEKIYGFEKEIFFYALEYKLLNIIKLMFNRFISTDNINFFLDHAFKTKDNNLINIILDSSHNEPEIINYLVARIYNTPQFIRAIPSFMLKKLTLNSILWDFAIKNNFIQFKYVIEYILYNKEFNTDEKLDIFTSNTILHQIISEKIYDEYFITYDIVEYFINAILISEFSNKQKLQILNAKNCYGSTALYNAFNNDRFTKVKIFIDAILNDTNLTSVDKIQIFQSALMMFQDLTSLVKYDLFKYVFEAILNYTNFNTEQKFQLLQIKNKYGEPLLYSIIQSYWRYGKSQRRNEQENIIKFYIKMILANNDFTNEQKLTLLKAKDINGVTGLSLAAKKKMLNLIADFTKIVAENSQFKVVKKFKKNTFTIRKKIF